ncbi:rhodanese-like domain-containing protein [Paenibacillus sp. CN-4]|uniref:rhodanese-like domain-containing protein n=1 Tax=Paenibacillus nanchangensis TaxID=3348343 RepID=UPI00397B7C91
MYSIPQITVHELNRRLEAGEQPLMIDVREDEEVAYGMIAGAKHLPMGDIPYRIDEIPADREVIFICRSGSRSQRVCEFLAAQGFESVVNMQGGMIEWYEQSE